MLASSHSVSADFITYTKSIDTSCQMTWRFYVALKAECGMLKEEKQGKPSQKTQRTI